MPQSALQLWALPEAWRAKLGSCLLTGMLGSEARLARFLRMTPTLFLRGLLSPVGTDRVLLPRRGRRPVEAEKTPAWSRSCLSPSPRVGYGRAGVAPCPVAGLGGWEAVAASL